MYYITKQNKIIMKNLELLKQLSQEFEFTFVEESKIRVVEWVGPENEQSLRKALKHLQLSDIESDLKELTRRGQVMWFFDDESLHIEFVLSLPMTEAVQLDLDVTDWVTKPSAKLMTRQEKFNKEEKIKSLIRNCTAELDDLQSVGNKWIMPNEVFRNVLKGMPHVEERWEQVWNRRESLKRLLFKF